MKKIISISLLSILFISCQNIEKVQTLPKDFEGKVSGIYTIYQINEAREKTLLSYQVRFTFYFKNDKLAEITEDLPGNTWDSLTIHKPLYTTSRKKLARASIKKRKTIYNLQEQVSYSFYLNPEEIKLQDLATRSNTTAVFEVVSVPYTRPEIPSQVKINAIPQIDSTILGYACEKYELNTPIPEGDTLQSKVWLSPLLKTPYFPHFYTGFSLDHGELNNQWVLSQGLPLYMEGDVLTEGMPFDISMIYIWQVKEISEEAIPDSIFAIPNHYRNGKWHYNKSK